MTKREAPDYHTIIKKPMALNDVKKKVDKVPSPVRFSWRSYRKRVSISDFLAMGFTTQHDLYE